MDTNKIAEVIRAKTLELKDRNGDVVDATISPRSLIDALADLFAVEMNINPPCPCKSCTPFDKAEFLKIAKGE